MPDIKDKIERDFTPRFLEKIDKRTSVGKALWGRWETLVEHLGGEPTLSYQKLSLARRAIWLEAMIEQQEIEASDGNAIDTSRHVAQVNSLVGLYRALGFERQTRDISLGEYLAQGGEE